jgi:hypothetical protein
VLEAAADGNALDAGQAALVRSMCTSGARLQLAIAPAGAGKTTAMRILALASSDSGGHVVGLAPSAAAAAQLRDATGAPAETLAKLTWSVDHNELPAWAQRIGRSTLVIIDEAGMADTLALNTAVTFIVRRGGSIRLVGDDQQLAAIGAGGVLRDIESIHGAVRLSELYRFTDPAEAASTPGRKTAASAWTPSCWPPPGSWFVASTNAPGTTASQVPLRAGRSSWPTATWRASAT